MPTREKLIELLDYDPLTGLFIWKPRCENYFGDTGFGKAWNKRYAGKVTGNNASKGYVQISIDNIRYLAHRLAWIYVHGDIQSECIDHINGDRSDNRIANLRQASFTQNLMNSQSIAINKVGVRGVYWDKKSELWRVACSISRKRTWLGSFDSLFEAAAARKSYEAKNYADFSRAIYGGTPYHN